MDDGAKRRVRRPPRRRASPTPRPPSSSDTSSPTNSGTASTAVGSAHAVVSSTAPRSRRRLRMRRRSRSLHPPTHRDRCAVRGRSPGTREHRAADTDLAGPVHADAVAREERRRGIDAAVALCIHAVTLSSKTVAPGICSSAIRSCSCIWVARRLDVVRLPRRRTSRGSVRSADICDRRYGLTPGSRPKRNVNATCDRRVGAIRPHRPERMNSSRWSEPVERGRSPLLGASIRCGASDTQRERSRAAGMDVTRTGP